MPFQPPAWVPQLPFEIPDTLSICDFMFGDQYGRHPLQSSLPPFTCGITGKAPSALEVKETVDFLARGLSKELGWHPNQGTEWDKVAAIFSPNTIDFLPLAWAIHRLGGIQTPANVEYSATDLAYQLKGSGAQSLFTSTPVLATALKAAKEVGIPRNRIYLLDLPTAASVGHQAVEGRFKTVSQLIEEGKKQRPLEKLIWAAGEGKRRVAYLCYSSGTSGLPKAVMISHYNVIANTLQVCTFDQVARDQMRPNKNQAYLENVLGLLPLSHIYGTIVISHVSIFRGDRIILLPKFNFKSFLQVVQDYRINTLYLVPPVIVMMTKNKSLVSQYNLSHVTGVYTGAAPLRQETIDDLLKVFPSWNIRQGYGLTETCTVVSTTSHFDIWHGSAGSLAPGVEARIVDLDGKEITECDQRGELLVKSPAVVIGYLNNQKANEETFITDNNDNRWIRTGDEVMMKKSPLSGNEHLFIVDRIKELIKVKGFQLAPAELEAALLVHPYVADCAVIPQLDDAAGEVPKAYVVKSVAAQGVPELAAIRDICKYIEEHKSRHKWLKGGVEFIDVIPKSPSGKILRRLLRDRNEARRKPAPKL